MITKKFNLEMARSGKSIQTKLGNPARIITVTNDGKLLVEVKYRYTVRQSEHKKYVIPTSKATVEKFNLDGRKYRNTDTEFDLEMVDQYEVAA